MTIILRFTTIVLFFFIMIMSIRAQNPNEEWFFVYFPSFPHPFWDCPICGTIPGNGSPPETRIGHAANGSIIGPNGNPIWTRDLNLSVTLNGGKLMGGNFDKIGTCEYNMLGYGTTGHLINF